jgi:hypothetical protein
MLHHITVASSVDAASGDAFAGAGADTLIVDTGAYLIAESSGHGANLTGPWTVSINGAVESFSGFAGIDLEASSGSDLAIVNIGRTGSVVGGVGIFSDVPWRK